MSRVTYFQRYSAKENAVTNTVLHLFARIAEASTDKFNDLLLQIDENMPQFGITFEQQTRSGPSVPDGCISQQRQDLWIETKVDAAVVSDQLIRHCADKSGTLLLLTRDQIDQGRIKDVRNAIRDRHGDQRMTLIHISFAQLWVAVKDLFPEYESGIDRIIQDFGQYCKDMELFDRTPWIMRVVPTGNSFDLNCRHRIYYHPSTRGYSPFRLLGLYNWKEIRCVGDPALVVDVALTDGELIKQTVSGQDDRRFDQAITAIIRETRDRLGWDIAHGYRFFCVDAWHDTSYTKTSSGGIFGARNHDLEGIDGIDTDTPAEAVAKILRGRTWG